MEPSEGPGDSAASIPIISAPEFQPLPPSAIFDSLDDLVASVQQHQRENGACVVRRNYANYRDFEGSKKPTYCQLLCDRGARRPIESTGLRNTASRKLNCPFKLTASATKPSGWRWSYKVVNGTHNHLPSLDPSSHTIHRRRTKEQMDVARSMIQYQGVPAREMADILRDHHPEPSFFKDKDIYNDRYRLKALRLEGYTPTQAWVRILQNEGLKHEVHYDNDHRITAVFWTYPWCEEMWKTFPEVLGLDNTYKTNRYKMYLFQVTGMTDQLTVANFAFGLINSETEEAYSWLCETLEAFRAEVGATTPTVIITDKEQALKNALNTHFPHAQQQLCVYHINANINARIRSAWKGSINDANDGSDDELTRLTEQDFAAAASAEEAASTPSSRSVISTIENDANTLTPEEMFRAWQSVIYAPTEKLFEEAWKHLVDQYNSTQAHTIQYILREYFPWRHQWAGYLISQYHNFGQRVNSLVESAHKQLKSFLMNGTATLYRLHTGIVQMLDRKERAYKEATAQQEVSILNRYRNADWMGDLPLLLSRPALELIWEQGKRARAALLPHQDHTPLEACSDTFTHQYGLPCKHAIFEVISAGQSLQKEGVHPRWWLRKPLDIDDAIRRIRDPAVIERLRGRPRGSRNKKVAIPAHLRPTGGTPVRGSRPPASQQPVSRSTQNALSRSFSLRVTHLSQPSLSQEPSPSPLGDRNVRRAFPSNLRRDPSHDELQLAKATAHTSRTKRSRTNTQGASRGTGIQRRSGIEGRSGTEGRVMNGASLESPVEDFIVVQVPDQ
jgi:hypothetical protein